MLCLVCSSWLDVVPCLFLVVRCRALLLGVRILLCSIVIAAYLGSLCCYFPCLVFSLSVTACNFSCCYSCSDVAAYLGSLCRVIPFDLVMGSLANPIVNSLWTYSGLSWGLLSNLVNPIVNSLWTYSGLSWGLLSNLVNPICELILSALVKDSF
jgi:hypothetical protein